APVRSPRRLAGTDGAVTAEDQPGCGTEDQGDQNRSGDGHARGTEAARTRQASARAKTAPRGTLIPGVHRRRPCCCFARPLPQVSAVAASSWAAFASWTRYTLLGT